jgi:hypothetical protein
MGAFFLNCLAALVVVINVTLDMLNLSSPTLFIHAKRFATPRHGTTARSAGNRSAPAVLAGQEPLAEWFFLFDRFPSLIDFFLQIKPGLYAIQRLRVRFGLSAVSSSLIQACEYGSVWPVNNDYPILVSMAVRAGD